MHRIHRAGVHLPWAVDPVTTHHPLVAPRVHPGDVLPELLANIAAALPFALIAHRAAPGPVRETCLACGCLCLPDEHCPGCEARRLNRGATNGKDHDHERVHGPLIVPGAV